MGRKGEWYPFSMHPNLQEKWIISTKSQGNKKMRVRAKSIKWIDNGIPESDTQATLKIFNLRQGGQLMEICC